MGIPTAAIDRTHSETLRQSRGYHPCSTHETRTSYDAVQKAKDQLDVRRDIFGEVCIEWQEFE